MQPPLVVVLLTIRSNLVGDDKIAPVGKENPPFQLNAPVTGVDLAVVSSRAGERIEDKGIVTAADGLAKRRKTRRSLAIDQYHIVVATFVYLVVVAEVYITGVKRQHLATGVDQEARLVRMLVRKPSRTSNTVLTPQQHIGGFRRPVAAEDRVPGPRHKNRWPVRWLGRRNAVVVEGDRVHLGKFAHIEPIRVVFPVPAMYATVGINRRQIVTVKIIEVTIVDIRPAAIGQPQIQ